MKKTSLSLIIALLSSGAVCAQNSFPTGAGTLVGIAIATGYTATHSLTLGSTATGIAAYSSIDQTTNYQRMVQGWNGGIYQIGTYFGGSASYAPLQIGIQPAAGSLTLSGGRVLSINPNTYTTEGIFDFYANTAGASSIITMQGTAGASSGVQNWLSIQPTIGQSYSAGYRALLISPYLATVGSGAANYLIDAGTSSAANGGGTYTSRFVVTGNGNVGIGTTGPLTPFDVKLAANQHIQFATNVNGVYTGASGIVCINDANTAYTPLGFYASNYYFGGGNVGINTTYTYGYNFAVNGTAIATSMTVKPYTGWPDYVFKKQYRLRPLAEVKTYLIKNQHLPDMPSAPQVAKEGINLGEMDKLLVKKVEELTLYIIELNKQLKEQQKEIDELKAKQ